MTDPTATIRSYLSGGLLSRPSKVATINALAALEAELTALRETALDLSRVAGGYRFHALELWRGSSETFWCAFDSPNAPRGPYISGLGPTPRAALDAAIARAKEHGEPK